VTRPAGIFTFVATAGTVNNTDSIGGALAGDFQTALSGHSGPFLKWDTGLPQFDLAGREYIGNFAVAHTITGSPGGTNVFRIDGPGAGGPGSNTISTNLFTVVGVKTPPPHAPVAHFTQGPSTRNPASPAP